MRAWQVQGAGEPVDVLHEVELEPPVPGPGEVRIRVTVLGVTWSTDTATIVPSASKTWVAATSLTVESTPRCGIMKIESTASFVTPLVPRNAES